MALAPKLAGSRFARAGRGPGLHRVYGIVSDGDLMEGVAAEAASLAGHLGLGNLIYLYDDNKISIDGPTSLCFGEDVGKRFEAYGWQVLRADGQDWRAIRSAIESARTEESRPSLVILRTTIGFGSPNKANSSKAHGEKLGADEVKLTKQALGWPLEPSFLVPDDVRAYLSERIQAKRDARKRSDEDLARWREAEPALARAWEAQRAGALPANLAEQLAEGLTGVAEATRKHGATVLERLAKLAPQFVGGSADLAGSAAPPILKGRGNVGPGAGVGVDPFAGANLYFGVREHAMGSISNGIALDGSFRPYCGTFLIFSDYMRPAIRLSALMGAKSVFVFTHDSIFLGEDGPTHQPIEQLDSLRAIPNLPVFRPADGVETAAAWAWIAERASGPALLALTRQTVPGLTRPSGFALRDVWKGGYTVRDSAKQPGVVLAATGSEVSLACAAAELLEADGIAVRVVSVPCVELLLEQPQAYRDALLPRDGTPIVAVEAGVGESLRRLTGPRGFIYGIDRFGASAPLADLAQHYGFTAPQLAARVRAHLAG
jgi:transketolase